MLDPTGVYWNKLRKVWWQNIGRPALKEYSFIIEKKKVMDSCLVPGLIVWEAWFIQKFNQEFLLGIVSFCNMLNWMICLVFFSSIKILFLMIF